MAKHPEKNELEYLRAHNKRLMKENRNLKRHLSRKEKREYLYEDLETKEAELLIREEMSERQQLEKTDQCPKCDSKIDVVDCGKVVLYLCTKCEYRSSKRV